MLKHRGAQSQLNFRVIGGGSVAGALAVMLISMSIRLEASTFELFGMVAVCILLTAAVLCVAHWNKRPKWYYHLPRIIVAITGFALIVLPLIGLGAFNSDSALNPSDTPPTTPVLCMYICEDAGPTSPLGK